MSLFDSVLNLATDLTKIVVAPVEVVVDVAAATVKPVAEVVEDLTNDVKDALK